MMKKKMFFLILLGLVSQACSGPVTNSGRGVGGASSRGASSATSGQNLVGRSACASNSIGWIYDDGSGQFQSRLQSFVSVSLEPGDLGPVSGWDGSGSDVEVQMQARFTQQGQFIAQDSFLEITIYDSFVGQTDSSTGEPIEPYVVSLEQASQGSYNSTTGQYQITYQDEYGSVLVEGSVQGSEFVGVVKFQNFVSWNGASGQSGVLGTIRVPSCSISIQ